ncbi:MAG: Wzz/FepE/Etk N-terminal domain-containing protein [Halanaerobiales bacterium]|nr:Wzz/FepE/Etk N-terminal domain-containing protein [Halanaerobiales bacterium]
MNEDNIHNDEYIEIDLKEYLYILWKNKILILTIVILAVLGSFLISRFVMTNIYSVQSTVRLTNLENSMYSNGASSSRFIKSRSFLQNVNKNFEMNLENNMIDRMLSNQNNFLTVNGNSDSPFIDINIKGENPEQITNLANNISEYFIRETERDLENQKEIMQEHINSLEQEKSNIDELNNSISKLITNVSNTNSDNQLEVNYIQNTLFDIKNNINKFSLETTNKIYTVKNELNNISSAQIISPAEVPENPSEPNTKLNVAIGFVLGLFLAIFIVFIKEFLKGTDWSEYEKK